MLTNDQITKQIEKLAEIVSNITSNVAELTNNVSTLAARVDIIESTIEDLKSNVTAIEKSNLHRDKDIANVTASLSQLDKVVNRLWRINLTIFLTIMGSIFLRLII